MQWSHFTAELYGQYLAHGQSHIMQAVAFIPQLFKGWITNYFIQWVNRYLAEKMYAK